MRPPDNDFSPDEQLYLRLKPESFKQGGISFESIPLDEVRLPDFSVNRSKYSHPEDVVKPRPTYGIAEFKVKDIPGPLPELPEIPVFSFRVEHLPGEDNYSHSEVWTYKDGQHSTSKPPRMVRMRFRALLHEKMTLIKLPNFGD